MLHMLCGACVHVTVSELSADMLISMYLSIYLFMFHGFLQVGEVTKSHNNIDMFRLYLATQSVTITFCRAKHLVGPPIPVSIPASGGMYCPASNVVRYLAARGTSPGPLFVLEIYKPSRRTCSMGGWIGLYVTAHYSISFN